MSDIDQIRRILLKIDYLRDRRDKADRACRKIRMGERPRKRGRLLGFFGLRDSSLELTFDDQETEAIFQALRVVGEEAEKRATALEAYVNDIMNGNNTEEGDRT